MLPEAHFQDLSRQITYIYRTYREKRNRITYFFRAPYMVLVVGGISTVTSLSYNQRGMAAKLISCGQH